ncbi:COG1902: NADH:flavin oxidoreductases, Old Yellow Enzyme family [hydrothermal vent metagenome]|uniref:COG1902: NADH:flavin oxidoreductases, Old Yellow Enzyme family n=1 Tax=hydrothermal vent metagenome TaxID=652676 RepID=A0A3B1A5K9_9ZZZZ
MKNKENKDINLFSAGRMGAINVANRVVMAPLTRNRAASGNVPQAMNVEYYRQRATAGLIITEASQVSPQGVGYPATPGIYSAAQVAGWKKVTDAVHKEGGKIVLQLWHVGRISHPSMQPNNMLPVAPSAIKPKGEAITYEGMQAFVEPHALDLDEIKAILEQYKVATENAKLAGFDGVEIHAANGYLIDQFLRDGANQRNDEYGGSLENRYRLLGEVIGTVMYAWDVAHVGVRLSPENTFNDIHDSNPQETFNYVTQQLGQLGLAYLHVVEGDMVDGSKKLDYQQFKNNFAGHYMANFAYDLTKAEAAIKTGAADSIAFGALYIANPDLVERFKSGADLNQPNPDTFYGGDEVGYIDYPFLEKEAATA